MSDHGQEVVVSGAPLPLTELAYTKFDQGRIDLLQKSINVDAPLPTFYAFLELSARYDLDPLSGEIWLATMPGRNGARGRVAVMVGRDGYLKIARRDPDFIDVDADVVYSEDEFRVTRKADGTRSVEHSYGNPARRGEAQGAYAVLRREGKPDRYFYAPLEQYAKKADKSAWSYRDAMAIKAATSYITRLTYGVSGPVPVDEIEGGIAFEQNGSSSPGGGEAPMDFDAGLPTELAGLVARAHSIDPKAWRANEVAARLPEREDRNFDRTVEQITVELKQWLDENEPQDAVVVHDAPGNEGVDVAAALQHRWETDPQWRQQVEPVINSYADLEVALDTAVSEEDGSAAAEYREKLAAAEADLDALGVPAGWWPESAGAEA